MTINNQLLETNQTTGSSRMKSTFLLLCIALLIVSIALYLNTNITWETLHTYLINNRIIATYPLVNSTEEISKIHVNRQFAIFACSIHSSVQSYSFYTPITASSWNRVGYQAIVIFVGDFTLPNVLTARLKLSRAYLKHVGAHVLDVQCNASYAVKLSQLVRVFSGFLPDSIVHDDDYILTGDSDLMPLKINGYTLTNGTDGFIFNALCCGTFKRRGKSYRMYPMGHIYLQKKVWRAMILESKQRAELLANTDQQKQKLLSENASISFETISIYVRHEFKDTYDNNMVKGDSAWYMDQVLCSMLLADYREKHKNLTINERGRSPRLDRSHGIKYWNRDKFDEFGDAHLIHDAILHEPNWIIFNRLLKTLFNGTLINLFNDYYKQYIIAKQ
ncbi:unnamed protein product [Adineta steineri]|uniref:Uncharacterized protein n=2 Tax=Adineta steineri TaxID=433720 RepID=A0A819JY57_9BILA|nr:unnamed protein product [Adineta steineri]